MSYIALKKQCQNEWENFRKKASILQFHKKKLGNEKLEGIEEYILNFGTDTIKNMKNMKGLIFGDFKEDIENMVYMTLYNAKSRVINGQLGIFVIGVYRNSFKILNSILEDIKKNGISDTQEKEIEGAINDILFEFEQAGLALGIDIKGFKGKEAIGFEDIKKGNSAPLKYLLDGKDPEKAVAGMNIDFAVKIINDKLENVIKKVYKLDELLTDIKKPN